MNFIEIHDNVNTIITDNDYNVLYTGSNIIKYLNKNIIADIGYEGSYVEKNDIVIFIETNYKNNNEYNVNELKCLGVKNDFAINSFVIIGSYNNNEVQPIYKYNMDNVCIDTIFCGLELVVKLDNIQKYCIVTVNNSSIKCNLDKFSNQLVIVNNEGIKYFRDEYPQSRLNKARDIFNRKKFNNYIRVKKINDIKVNLRMLLCSEISDKLTKLEGEEYFKFHNSYIRLSKNSWKSKDFYMFQIDDQNDLLESIIRDIKKYDNLELHNKDNAIIDEFFSSYKVLGQNENTKKVKDLLRKASTTNITIMLLGESGTGKTFMAHEIHKNSKRHNESFIHVNCASIPYNLIESELFGYSDGAFTGARKGGKKGYFELADNGTIFLDEITEMPVELQGKLLEVIQNKTFYRVGGTEKVQINVRLIVATNRNLKNLILENKFREDLYYRINVFPIELPPLRERISDLYMIITTLLPDICKKLEVEPLILSPEALEKMKTYDWPGNIRELENILEKAVILSEGKFIKPEDILINEDCKKNENMKLKDYKEEYEKNIIQDALNRFNGEKAKTAKYLGIGRTSLFEKIKKYNIV